MSLKRKTSRGYLLLVRRRMGYSQSGGAVGGFGADAGDASKEKETAAATIIAAAVITRIE
jgi:hypothetical protein